MVVARAYLEVQAWGEKAENDSRAQRNTKKVDPSTNRRSVCNATMLRLVMRPGAVMVGREMKPGVDRMGAKRPKTRAKDEGAGRSNAPHVKQPQ